MLQQVLTLCAACAFCRHDQMHKDASGEITFEELARFMHLGDDEVRSDRIITRPWSHKILPNIKPKQTHAESKYPVIAHTFARHTNEHTLKSQTHNQNHAVCFSAVPAGEPTEDEGSLRAP